MDRREPFLVIIVEPDTDAGRLEQVGAGHPEPLLLVTAGSTSLCASIRRRGSA